MLVLIVDDDEDDVVFFLEALRSIDANIDCISASDGDEALSILRSAICRKPDFIFSDLNMPRLDGIQLLIELKNNSTLRNIPFTMLTTSQFKEDKEKALKLGAANFITKPTEFSCLISALSKVIFQMPDDLGK
jgi:CheY-like chemotaxis protein